MSLSNQIYIVLLSMLFIHYVCGCVDDWEIEDHALIILVHQVQDFENIFDSRSISNISTSIY